MTNKEYADSLRLIADFYEQNEEMPLPYDNEKFKDFQQASFDVAISLFPSFKKEFDKDFQGSVALTKWFGSIQMRLILSKNQVCTKRVVGVYHVEKIVIPARDEQVVEAHDEDIIEWDCNESWLKKINPKEITESSMKVVE